MELIKKNRWYIAGMTFTAIILIFVLFIFSQLGHTDKGPLLLQDTGSELFGWSYELLENGRVRPYEPEFSADGFVMLPEGTEAVRITRTMTEDIFLPELQWMRYSDGVEVSLDGDLLHSDFPEAKRGDDGFLRPTGEEWEQLLADESAGRLQIQMSLPAGYTGKRLSMTTYFPEDSLTHMPEYPTFGDPDSYNAPFIVSSYAGYNSAVFCAILTFLTAGIFLLDLCNKKADGRTLLLCLYFALLFLHCVCDSALGYYSVVSTWENLGFLYGIYIAPLYLYLSLRLTGWRRYLPCAGIAAWVVYECVCQFRNIRQGLIVNYGNTGREMLVLILLLAAVFCAECYARRGQRGWRKKLLYSCGLSAAVTAVYLLGQIRIFGGVRSYLVDSLWASLCVGEYGGIVGAVTDIASYLTLILVAAEIVRRTLRTRRTMDVLREREQHSMDNYRNLLAAQKATSAMRHEMRHHFIALAGILESGDAQRAEEYVSAVTGELDRVPAGYYSKNMLVNVIAGSYLDQARSQGIRIRQHLDIPKSLAIADEDLSVFLSNMLQNALEACERMDTGAKRFIHVQMRLEGDFLFIKCVNSKNPAEPSDMENAERPGHGYGLAAMRRIAEKYGSVLLVNPGGTEFEVKSRLCLRESA